jgi:hypothetical protein
LRQSIADAIAAVPETKKGQAGVAVTTRGVQFEVGYKPKSWLSVGGYAGRDWSGGRGWNAGALAKIVW